MALDPFRCGDRSRLDEWRILDPLIGDSMLELGNKKNGEATYKKYFEALGFRHVSVDWNGEDGALKRDLRKPLWEELGQFDMLTNIGTSEHVGTTAAEQGRCWENIHYLVKRGGIYCGLTPYPDGRNWWWHGTFYPTTQFFESFSRENGWLIERMYKDRLEPFCNLYVRMKKVADLEFTTPDLTLIKRNLIQPRHWRPA
jgi:SAM-dependent methyltransferase